MYVCRANIERDSRTNRTQSFVHPPGLQLAWLPLSLSVGMSEGLWAPASRSRCACDTSLSMFCRLSSARSLSSSNLRILSWRFLSAERIAGNRHCVRKRRGNAYTRISGAGRRRVVTWTKDGRRCSRDILAVWRRVAHAPSSWCKAPATIPKRKLPCKRRSAGLRVTCTVSLWQRLARHRGRPGQTHTRLRCVDEGTVSGIVFVRGERQAARYYAARPCCWCMGKRLQRHIASQAWMDFELQGTFA